MSFLEHDGEVTELKPGELTVGSGKEVTLRLQQVNLAPHHMTLMTGQDGTTVVRPFGAQLIVTVNGRRITEPTRLSEGDVIGAGGARIGFFGSQDRSHQHSLDESAWLVAEDGKMAYALARRTVNIGRDATNTIQVKDPDTSRQHTDITSEAGLHVLNAVSEHGTKVNGSLVQNRILEEGDRIEIGELKLRYTRTAPPTGTKVSSGGDEYDLDVSARPTGAHHKITESPIDVMNSPKVLRGAAVVFGVMIVIALAILIFF